VGRFQIVLDLEMSGNEKDMKLFKKLILLAPPEGEKKKIILLCETFLIYLGK
jgi:hypothetical protein